MKQLRHWIAALGAAALAGSLAAAAPGVASATTVRSDSPPPATRPGAPTNLTATNVGDGTFTLNWDAPANNGGASIEGYNVYVSNGDGSGNEYYIPWNGIVLVHGTSYQFGSGTNEVLDDYGDPSYFEVTAVNATGLESTVSSELSVDPVAQKPNAPTTVSAVGGYESAVVSWNQSFQPNNVTPADSYTVYAIDAGPTNPGTSITNCVQAQSPCTVTGLTDGDSYTFEVEGYDDTAGYGGLSSPSNAIVPAPTAPGVVSDLVAQYGNGDAILFFHVPAQNDSIGSFGLNIYQGTSPGGESSTPINGNYPITSCDYGSFTSGHVCGIDLTGQVPGETLTNGTQYYWTVSAINQIAPAAAVSNEATAMPTDIKPGAPTLSASGGPGTASLSWTAPSNTGGWPIVAYRIYGCPSGDINVPASTTSYTCTGLTYGDTYDLTVAAFSAQDALNPSDNLGVGERTRSVASNMVSVQPTDVPAAVTDFAVSTHTTSTDGNINISWTVPSYIGNAGTMSWAYILDGNKTTIPYASITCSSGNASTPNSPCSYSAGIPATNNNPHTITIVGQNVDGNDSAVSNAVSFQGGQFTIGAPQNLTATANGNGEPGLTTSVTLNWNPPSYLGEYGNSVGSYTVWINSGSGWSTDGSCSVSGTSCTDSTLSNGTSYQFQVTATGTAPTTTSAFSNVASVTPSDFEDVPGSPTGGGNFGSSATAGTMSWGSSSVDSGSPAVLGYDVLRYDNFNNLHVMNTSLITGTSFSMTDLVPGTQFVVVAYNGACSPGSHYDCGWSGTSTVFTFEPPVTGGPSAPGAPTDLSVVTDGTLVQNTWQAPSSDGGAPIEGYNLYISNVVINCSSDRSYFLDYVLLNDFGPGYGEITSTSAVSDLTTANNIIGEIFDGYDNGTCTLGTYGPVYVSAVNAAGEGPDSFPANPVVGQVGAFLPSAPSSVSANRAGGGSIFVAWPPSDGNGAAVTSYTVTPYDNGVAGNSVTVTGTSTTFNGLTPGDNYYFTVAGTNSVGTGPVAQSNVLSVGKYSSTTKLSVSKSIIIFGKEKKETFHVKVSGPAGAPTPTGTVSVGGVCKITLSGGSGSCTLSNKQLKVGKYSFHAVYSGDRNFGRSSSKYVSVKVEA